MSLCIQFYSILNLYKGIPHLTGCLIYTQMLASPSSWSDLGLHWTYDSDSSGKATVRRLQSINGTPMQLYHVVGECSSTVSKYGFTS